MTPVLAILGPTASGKSALALALAEMLGGEIVACDAMTVYRGLDVGTAKATAADRARVRHHLLDVVAVGEAYDVQRYVAAARAVIADCGTRGTVPILCGGSGLYARSLLYRFEPLPADPSVAAVLRERFEREGIEPLLTELESLDAAAAARTRDNPRRVLRALEAAQLLGGPIPTDREMKPTMPCLQIVLMPEAAANRRRIGERARQMLAGGWLEETQGLVAQGLLDSPTARQALGYDLVARHLAGELDAATLAEKIVTATCRYAKRQRTWFRNQHPGAFFVTPPSNEAELRALANDVQGRWRRFCDGGDG